MLSSSFINYIVKETSASSTVIISFDSYCENSLKALTSIRWKGDHLKLVSAIFYQIFIFLPNDSL